MTYEHRRIHYGNWMQLRKAKTSSKGNTPAVVTVVVLLLVLPMFFGDIEEKEEVQGLCFSNPASPGRLLLHPS